MLFHLLSFENGRTFIIWREVQQSKKEQEAKRNGGSQKNKGQRGDGRNPECV